MSTGPTINRYNSEQDVGTPLEFIEAVGYRFGPLSVDLAATQENKKAPLCITPAENSLSKHWHLLNGLLWLNPPFGEIGVWAQKCAEAWLLGAKILLLVPASVGSNWYWDWVKPFANEYSIGRLKFVGHTTVYPKDLLLFHYDRETPHVAAMQRWKWRADLAQHRKYAAALDSYDAVGV